MLGLLLGLAGQTARAGDRLTATGGISDLDGAGGGGIVPWAVITGTGTEDQISATAHVNHVELSHFRLDSDGVAVGIDDRLELSLDRLTFSLGTTVPGAYIREDVAGIKLRLAGDAVFEPDRWMPQIAAGAEYKHNLDEVPVPQALGARRDADTDVYLAASKLVFSAVAGRNLLLDFTLRATRANQLGLLGFGGDRGDRYRFEPEGSVGLFLRDNLVLGAEYKRKPDQLSAFHESDWYDLFVAWLPSKQLSLTAAWTHLGQIANQVDERGLYLGLQVNP